MAAAAVTTLFLFFCSLLLPHSSSALPLCTDLRAPEIQKAALSFCPYSGRVCCDSAKDLELKKQFQAMNVSDSGCASVIKSILCATCDQFAEELFRVDTGPGPVPVLCKSNGSANSPSSSHTESSFCSQVWDACQNTAILNSPFATSLQSRTGVLQNSTSTKLTELWQSKSEFCEAFGGASGNDSLCFNGKPVSLNDTETSVPPKGLCLEKIGEGQYLNMVAHPDGSNRAFFSSQAGKIWLATIPEQGSGGTLDLDESSPFVDLTDQVHLDTTFGVMGMAFHPNFAQNGRFFTSFNCDKVKSPTCSGRCSCNSDVNCDPSKLNSSKGAQPCQYHSVIAEYTASGTASEPSAEEVSDLGLWGNYSIPRDNPYHEDKELKPEIWALGLRNPWRCSFDSERPSYFLCADVGQDRYEEVDIITKGGNYGWSIYEGPLPFNNQHFPSNTSADSETLIFPVLGYNHSAVNSLGSAAISGGYFYNSKTDPCVHGSYLYGDLYGGAIWAAAETPRNSGNMTASSVPFSCASDSPIACHFVPGSRQPALEYIFSFGQDNRKDVFILASSGVYRIVRPSRCNYTCSKETVTATDSPSSTPSSYGNNPVKPHKELVLFLLSLMLLAGTML